MDLRQLRAVPTGMELCQLRAAFLKGGTVGHIPTSTSLSDAHSKYWGFPGGASGKEPACQCRRRRRCGFDPWVRKIS